jgi:hypothetical protein
VVVSKKNIETVVPCDKISTNEAYCKNEMAKYQFQKEKNKTRMEMHCTEQ